MDKEDFSLSCEKCELVGENVENGEKFVQEDCGSPGSSVWVDLSFLDEINLTQIELDYHNGNHNNIYLGSRNEENVQNQNITETYSGLKDSIAVGENNENDDQHVPHIDEPKIVQNGEKNHENVVKVFREEAINVDLSSVFSTDEVFSSRKSLVDWCQSQGRKMKTIIVTMKSDGGVDRRPRLTLGCERSGNYRDNRKQPKAPKKRDYATRKCNCPFALRGVNLHGDKWKLEVKCGIHNHPLPNTLVGHPFCGRLSKEEKQLVVDMTFAGSKPAAILLALKRRNTNNASTLKTIYNAKSNLRVSEMEGRTTMQQLMKVLVEKHYVYWHRKDERTDEVIDLFWAHPESILLAKCFPSVVIVDCTYKTNRYKLALFAMVGITSTGKSFSIAHCFLRSEVEENYRWALSKLKMLFAPHDMPNVFVTDRENAVINAIGGVFPDAQRMLCTLHISRNVKQHCQPVFRSTAVWKKFHEHYTELVESATQSLFFERWEEFKRTRSYFKECIDYLVKNWFPHKQFFVHAWTNSIKHHGNRTTNRAEGSHAKLKRHLDSGLGSFQSVWVSMDNMLSLQINEVKASFEDSLGSFRAHHQGVLFRHIRGNLSHFALDLINKERDTSIEIGVDPSLCNHVLRTMYGLPCAHELLQYGVDNCPIPLEDIDDHWKKLTILPNIGDYKDIDLTAEMVCLKKLYSRSMDDEKKVLLRKIKEIAMPTTTSLKEPTPGVTKGRPRGSKNKLSQKEKKHEASTKRDPSGFEYAKTMEERLAEDKKMCQVSKPRKEAVKKRKLDFPKHEFMVYLPEIPEFMHPFISDIKDVRSDGNCGYRTIAEHLGWNDCNNNWKLVRVDLLKDLERYKSKYVDTFGGWWYDLQRHVLDCYDSPCDKEYWMCMPDMGYLAASAFNCVVVLISKSQCLTFYPHAEPPSEESSPRILPIAFVKNCHFIRLLLKDGAPIPKVASMWHVLASAEACVWNNIYVDENDAFKKLVPLDVATTDIPITLD